MNPGLYSIRLKGLDGVDWPVGGVAVLQDGVIAGGGTYTYFTGWYSSQDGIFKAEIVLNQHMPPPIGSRVLQRERGRHGGNGHLRERPGRADRDCAGREKIAWGSGNPTDAGAAWRG